MKDPNDRFTLEMPTLERGLAFQGLQKMGVEDMNNVHQLGAVKCPVGSKAVHSEYGWCEVSAAKGFERTVIVEIHEPDETLNVGDLPPGISPKEVVFSEAIRHIEIVVDVRDLREVSPKKDMQPRRTASQVLFHGG